MDTWLYRLQPASFRGVPFKVSGDEGTIGRRAITHEYPLRDKPFTEDLGRKARRYSVSAYVIGGDYMTQRDRLLTALEQSGSGTLVHPFYGAVTVNVDGEIKVRHSRENGGMCEISLQFVESGELNYPTAGGATAQNVDDAADAADSSFADEFLSDFNLDDAADWITENVIDNVYGILDEVISVFEIMDSAISDAAKLLQGDLSVLFPPPSKGAEFIQRVQEMWAAGKSIYYNTESALSAVDNLKYIVSDPALAPKGVWSTLSETQQTVIRCTNACAQLFRSTALSESTRKFSEIAAPKNNMAAFNVTRTHAAISAVPGQKTISGVLPVNYDQLTRQRTTYSDLFDQEGARVVGDSAYLALEDLRQAVLLDIRDRLQHTDKMITRTPGDTTPAVVLASDWYDDASRGAEIVALNNIPHPGFVPPEPIRTASE
ncbi:DNA circularization protein [Salmonella enterica]|nr:DNA circularization protein [Salmonella enterica]